MWLLLAIISALCLGFYDVSKKRALTSETVITVLTVSLIISSLLLLPELVYSRWMDARGATANVLFYVPRIDWQTHLFILLKSAIVLSSWVFTYISVKYLPLSVVSPMQATRPMWTLLGALTIFGEVLNSWQWAGILLALLSTFAFSFSERRGAALRAETGLGKYYVCLVLAILIGACSGLYDKYMMRHFDHNAVQVYYIFYQALMMGVVCLVTRTNILRVRRAILPIACISVFLILSDYVYLLALSDPDSLIAVVSTIRRGGTIIPFLYGIIILREPNPWRKVACLSGILLGLICLTLGTL